MKRMSFVDYTSLIDYWEHCRFNWIEINLNREIYTVWSRPNCEFNWLYAEVSGGQTRKGLVVGPYRSLLDDKVAKQRVINTVTGCFMIRAVSWSGPFYDQGSLMIRMIRAVSWSGQFHDQDSFIIRAVSWPGPFHDQGRFMTRAVSIWKIKIEEFIDR